jgi:hypothetical protein
MALFIDWMVYRDAATLLRLLESVDFFNPQDYNAVFDGELVKLIRRLPEGESRQQAMQMRTFDFAGYLQRSLLRAGYKSDDIQEYFHQIVIKLLVEPGRLFRGWEPQRHGPLDRRFRRSVWNAIRNAQEKNRNRRKWMTAVDPSVMAVQYAGRAIYNNIIGDFRRLVLSRLGRLALAILDARLAGEELKGLVGNAELGSPSGYQLKREVGEIKQLAHQFAQQTGDQVFLYKLVKAMDSEKETVAKRQAARQAQ